jgi:hypothetical protein
MLHSETPAESLFGKADKEKPKGVEAKKAERNEKGSLPR